MNQQELLAKYCKIARQEMLKYMPENSCIAASRLTLEFCKLCGIEAELLPTKFVVEVPELEIAYTSGLSEEEMANAKSRKKVYEKGWAGHLVVRAGDWLIDGSFDQALSAMGINLQEKEVICFPLQGAGKRFKAVYEIDFDGEHKARATYMVTDNHSYTETDAWKDEGIPLLARHLYNLICAGVYDDLYKRSEITYE